MDSPLDEPRAAYLHVPFCAHRCGYCDFTLLAGRDELIGDYLRALEIELLALERPRQVDTLFFGGGTPTHLSADDLQRLCELVQRWFPLSEGGEFSVEANPAGLTDEKLDVLHDFGVNRISLGVQSFSDELLRVLERDHRREEIADVMQRVRGIFHNVSLDLMFAVPGQTLETWRRSLDQAVALSPTHISTYGLTYERGTSFWSRRRKGTLVPADDELEREMYALAMDLLPEAGLRQYELSNFARPGFECRHNRVYWQGLPSFGCGPGAASYIGGVRRINHRSVTTWLKRVLNGESGVAETETLSPESRAREAVMLGLRQTDGIDVDGFAERFGFRLSDLAGDALTRLCNDRLLEQTGPHLRLTREGRFLADTVTAEFL